MQNNTSTIQILIADRDEHLRSALKLLLSDDHHDIKIDEAWNIESLMRNICVDKYHMLIIDWNFYRNRAQEVITELCHSNTKIIVLSNRLEDKTKALAAGAHAFVYKGDPPEYLHKILLTYVKKDSERSNSAPSMLSSSHHPIYCLYIV